MSTYDTTTAGSTGQTGRDPGGATAKAQNAAGQSMRRGRRAMCWCGVRGLRVWKWAVCSPGNIERRPGDRIKTDKRDAIRLARLFAAGDLRLVWVPSEEQERLRDLVRCREDLRADLMRARLRRAAFLLRRERYFPARGSAGRSGTVTGVSQQRFDDAPSRVTYADYLQGRFSASAEVGRGGVRAGADHRIM